jgi:uncharacterized protein YkwD
MESIVEGVSSFSMNRSKAIHIQIICIPLFLFFLAACSTTAGSSPIIHPSVTPNLPISIEVHLASPVAKSSPTPSRQKPSGANHLPAATSTPISQSGATPIENSIAQSVFQAINQSRAANGLPPLTWSSALARSARLHDLAMQAANTLSHQLPGEAFFGDRERRQGVNWTWAGENIGETSDQSVNGALSLHQAMMNEQPPDDGHRQNILTTSGNIVGIAIVIDTRNGVLWLTEDFAKV